MASTKSTANEQALMLAKSKASPEVWNELASAVIRRMGERQGSNQDAPGMLSGWSPDRFLTAYRNLSENGKGTLFGTSELRQSLDNLATVAERFRDLRKFQNTSGTAHAIALPEIMLNAFLAPLETFVAAALLSRPASARAISRWGDGVYNFMTGKAPRAAAKVLTMNLAREIADQNGGAGYQ